jgi:alkanesulfonate monooxygenase SsuD/methylene tetrahydromethanopterin reductase-like flavin-dependent oxidoreductase (luciferase family)
VFAKPNFEAKAAVPYGPTMKTGLFLPLFGDLAEPRCVVELAMSAEEAGWDGLFVWDHIFGQDDPVCDAFVALAAVAATTERIRLGPLVTPLARRRPWVLARQTTSVDHLSVGRLVLGIGLADDGWKSEPTELLEQAAEEQESQALLDEALAVLLALWSGKPVCHEGDRLHVDSAPFLPTPVQQPRIPIWATSRSADPASLLRAAKVDGVLPIFSDRETAAAVASGAPDPIDVRHVRDKLAGLGSPPDHDLVLRGRLGPAWSSESLDRLYALEQAGATWWLETFERDEDLASVVERVSAGPPPLP